MRDLSSKGRAFFDYESLETVSHFSTFPILGYPFLAVYEAVHDVLRLYALICRSGLSLD